MRDDITSDILTAIISRQISVRYFFLITAYNGGSPVSAAFWNGLGTVTYSTMDGLTRSLSDVTYKGSGRLITFSDIVMTNDLAVREVTVTLNETDDTVDTYLRQYDIRNASVQISRGLFNTDGVLKDIVFPQFVGFVDTSQIVTPSKNSGGSATLKCVSCTRDLTVGSAEKRSHESQIKRHPGDNFFKYASVMGGRQIPWGLGVATAPVALTGAGVSRVTKLKTSGSNI